VGEFEILAVISTSASSPRDVHNLRTHTTTFEVSFLLAIFVPMFMAANSGGSVLAVASSNDYFPRSAISGGFALAVASSNDYLYRLYNRTTNTS
jgi:hypothetical protein